MRIESVFFSLFFSPVASDTWLLILECGGKGLRKHASFNGEFRYRWDGIDKEIDGLHEISFPFLNCLPIFQKLFQSKRKVTPSLLNAFTRLASLFFNSSLASNKIAIK